jgi:hypothetical protein
MSNAAEVLGPDRSNVILSIASQAGLDVVLGDVPSRPEDCQTEP